jgi:hypothetical protein
VTATEEPKTQTKNIGTGPYEDSDKRQVFLPVLAIMIQQLGWFSCPAADFLIPPDLNDDSMQTRRAVKKNHTDRLATA